MSLKTAARDLWGGAVQATAPVGLVDASELRQVPDNQEVFLYPDSDISVVAEILQSVEPSDLSEAIKFHFDSLAHDNDAKVSTVLATERIANIDNELITILRGEQLVPKFNMVEPDLVQIFMALLRIEAKKNDIVVTFNVPVKSASSGAVGEEAFKLAEKDFDSFVRSLRIIDFAPCHQALPWLVITDSITNIAWNFDGEMIATGGMDGKIRLWRGVLDQVIPTIDYHIND